MQAKAKMRSIQERWEAAGKVPRERIREFDTRLRAVEEKVKSADERHWRRTDPETEARVQQFQSRVEPTGRRPPRPGRPATSARPGRPTQQAEQWEEWLKTARGAVER